MKREAGDSLLGNLLGYNANHVQDNYEANLLQDNEFTRPLMMGFMEPLEMQESAK
jgi:hypothetical protein